MAEWLDLATFYVGIFVVFSPKRSNLRQQHTQGLFFFSDHPQKNVPSLRPATALIAVDNDAKRGGRSPQSDGKSKHAQISSNKGHIQKVNLHPTKRSALPRDHKEFGLPLLKLTKKLLPALLVMAPIWAQAAPVVLQSPDGSITVSGELISFDGETISVETHAGIVRVRASRVECFGDACPTALQHNAAAPTVTIAAPTPRALAVAQSVLATKPSASSSRIALAGGASSDETLMSPAQVTFVPTAGATADDILITNASAPGPHSPLQDWVSDAAPSQLLAVKALSVVASPDAGVDRLTLTQIAQILAGEIVNWAEVGGNNIAINLVLPDEGTRLHEEVQAVVMRPARKPITPVFQPFQNVKDIGNAVHETPGSISVLPADLANGLNTLGVVDQCGVTTRPTDFAVRSGEYPLSQSTLVVYPHEIDETFIQSAFDNAARTNALTYLSEAGKVDRFVNLMRIKQSSAYKQDATDLIQMLIGKERLSINFIDGTLSQTSGAWARAHFVRLRDAILSGGFDGQEITFLGFADDTNAQAAQRLSQAAADRIFAAFEAFSPTAANRDAVRFRTSGQGTLSHAACVMTDNVAGFAPRVEVWTQAAPAKQANSLPHPADTSSASAGSLWHGTSLRTSFVISDVVKQREIGQDRRYETTPQTPLEPATKPAYGPDLWALAAIAGG